jgi:hypothetical protein
MKRVPAAVCGTMLASSGHLALGSRIGKKTIKSLTLMFMTGYMMVIVQKDVRQ